MLWKNNSNDNNESSLNCVYSACLIERNCKVKKYKIQNCKVKKYKIQRGK